MKSVFIYIPVGCPRSKIDGALLCDYFKANGWVMSTDIHNSDIILVGTCAVTTDTEKISLNAISLIEQKKKSKADILVFGCLPGINNNKLPEKLQPLSLTRRNRNKLDNLIDAKVNINDINYPNDIDSFNDYIKFNNIRLKKSLNQSKLSLNYYLKIGSWFLYKKLNKSPLIYSDYKKIFNIRVAGGCLGSCTFCAIKNANGPLISKPLEMVLTEFHAGLSRGYRVFRFIADDVGSYGQDLQINIVQLFSEIFKTKKDFQIVIDDFSPKWLVRYFPELSTLFAKNRSKIGYLGMPIQSGSNRIIQKMKREYNAVEIENCFLSLKKLAPEINFKTHVIVGFPGETEKDYEETLHFLKKVKFNLVSLSKYSDRPNTEATQLPAKVSELIKMRRILKTFYLLDKGTVLY